jgi:hypothetical protein
MAPPVSDFILTYRMRSPDSQSMKLTWITIILLMGYMVFTSGSMLMNSQRKVISPAKMNINYAALSVFENIEVVSCSEYESDGEFISSAYADAFNRLRSYAFKNHTALKTNSKENIRIYIENCVLLI